MASQGRVVDIDGKGGLGWGIGVESDAEFIGGRRWRGKGAEGMVHRTIAFSVIFMDQTAAVKEATNIRRTLSEDSADLIQDPSSLISFWSTPPENRHSD